MIEIMKQTRVSVLVIILTAITWIVMMPLLPDYIGMQYSMDGEIIWGANKYLAALIIVGIMILVYILAVIKPVIDPEKKSYGFFKKYFNLSILLAMLLVYFAGCLLMLVALDSGINLAKIVFITVGIILIFVGNYLPKVPTTWFVGIRNPWTLSDKDIWNKSHRFTAILYILIGFLFIITALFNFINLYVIVSLIAVCVVIPHLYSYLLYKRDWNHKNYEEDRKLNDPIIY